MDNIESKAKIIQPKGTAYVNYKGELDKGLAALFACVPSASRRQALINELQAIHNRIVRERWEEATK